LRIQVVLFHNDPAGLRRLVESLANTTRIARAAGLVGPARLRLGDCGPEAPSLTEADLADLRDRAQDAFALDLTVFEDNLGHGGGQNRLATDLDEDLLLVINPDTVAEPLLVSRLVERFAAPQVGIVEARQLPVEHPKDYAEDGRTGWASMACALLRASAVREVGLFDADTFFLHGDDVDLSWRMRLAGWEVVHQPTARVFHDKAVGSEGYIEAGAAEQVQGPLGSLLLAYKWSRDDQVTALGRLLRDGTPEQQRAWALFEERRAAGRLPQDRLDREQRVAVFTAGHFAHHRF
jgi:GT2 family glycosyltransferase